MILFQADVSRTCKKAMSRPRKYTKPIWNNAALGYPALCKKHQHNTLSFYLSYSSCVGHARHAQDNSVGAMKCHILIADMVYFYKTLLTIF